MAGIYKRFIIVPQSRPKPSETAIGCKILPSPETKNISEDNPKSVVKDVKTIGRNL